MISNALKNIIDALQTIFDALKANFETLKTIFDATCKASECPQRFLALLVDFRSDQMIGFGRHFGA